MNNYDDIINLPHYEPKYHKRMSAIQRASQFAPFSALTGYDDEVKETARLTNEKIILSEDSMNEISDNIIHINNIIKTKPLVSVTYFVKDTKKQGGKYLTITKNIKRIDDIYNILYMTDGSKISMNDIIEICVLED